MRTLWLAFVATLGSMALAAPVAAADDVQEQLSQMQERLTQLEDRLQATTDELEAANQRVEVQQQLVERAGLADGRAASSGLAQFLETLEIGGWVAASYAYNFDDPDGRDLAGFNAGAVTGGAYPFHPDANSFQLDQFWLELERPVSVDHRAGFRADLVYGKTAELLNPNEPINPDGFGGSDEDFELYQAYVQYLAPLGNGVHFKFGKFATIFGAEVAQSPYNFNITRGHIYNLFQPITNVGVLASTDLGGGWSGSLGLVNGTRSFPARDIDINRNKALLGSLGWSGEKVSFVFNATHGSADEGQGVETAAGDTETIYGVVLSWDPSEDFSSYINANYIDSQNDNDVAAPGALTGEFAGYGIAVAGRYALSERLGLALRGEWVDREFERVAMFDPDQEIWGLTGTLDYKLTGNLLVRGELRYDNLRSSNTPFLNQFFDSSSNPPAVPPAIGGGSAVPREDDQVVGLVEILYSFSGI